MKSPFACLSIFLFFYFPLTFSQASVDSKNHFEITPKMEWAYQLAFELRLIEAQQVLDSIKNSSPEALFSNHVENYLDFFKAFIGEEKKDLEAFKNNCDKRLEKIRQGPKTSPYYRFSQAEMTLQLALVKAKHKEYFSATWDINKAYKLLRENEKAFPDFDLNKKSLSLIHSLVGSITGFQKGLLQFFTALSGTVAQGIDEMDELYKNKDGIHGMFYTEVIAIKALMLVHVQDQKEEALALIQDKRLDKLSGPILNFLRGSIAYQAGKNDLAIQYFEYSKTKNQYPFLYLELIKGIAKLNRQDKDANKGIELFINRFRGINYIKEAYQKLAWYHLTVSNKPELYLSTIANCLTLGHVEIGEDEAALEEATLGIVPNQKLLQTRMLFDGGYFLKSLDLLSSLDEKDLSDLEKIEMHYRYGRNLQKLNRYEEALVHFDAILSDLKSKNSYFATNAALQAGIISFTLHDKELSKKYLNSCLNSTPKSHRKSLHSKAKMWLSRL